MRELGLYLAAAAAYIALGVVVPEVMFSFVEGVVFVLVAVWVLPALFGRVR